ncbi:hypothetical protein [Penaeicola halotolerans]|uniref:hypothetical protein n=1 Tax=Penaeicola halotolerans TaxID=2793196 RepID=UPI001CF91486|nr:hypothetical protein [Penaeicola halotolerans]
MLDIIILFFCLLLLVSTNRKLAFKYRLSAKASRHLDYLLAYHILFSLIFTYYILTFGGDSTGYWRLNLQQVYVSNPSLFAYYGVSTKFPLFLNYIPSKLLGLDYITGNLLYSFLGFIGIRFLYLMYARYYPQDIKVYGIRLFPWLFYLPNIHFWSAGVGKDTLCFWGIAWFAYAMQNYKRNLPQLIIAFLFVYHARPHMGFILLGAAAIAVLIGSEVGTGSKFMLIVLSAFIFFLISDQVLIFLQIEDFSFESLEDLSRSQQAFLNRASVGSGIDISGYPLPIKILTYLYRPLFIDAHNIVALISSVENFIYLLLTFKLFRNFSIQSFKDAPLFLKVGLITFVPVTVAFANSLSNLGITMRMKNMTMIYLLLFIAWAIHHTRQQKLIKAYKHRLQIEKLRKRAAA